jgi:hypothetical protein
MEPFYNGGCIREPEIREIEDAVRRTEYAMGKAVAALEVAS